MIVRMTSNVSYLLLLLLSILYVVYYVIERDLVSFGLFNDFYVSNLMNGQITERQMNGKRNNLHIRRSYDTTVLHLVYIFYLR